jgi:hypothetical protein
MVAKQVMKPVGIKIDGEVNGQVWDQVWYQVSGQVREHGWKRVSDPIYDRWITDYIYDHIKESH